MKYYIPGDNVIVDEQLIPFRGRVPFKQQMPSKPDKYGMKMWWLCDLENFYPLNGIPYLGKEGKDRAVGLSSKVVQDLVVKYKNSSRNMTCDNWFTDLSLAPTLYSSKLTNFGTVRKNKRFIPAEFLPARKTRRFFNFRIHKECNVGF